MHKEKQLKKDKVLFKIIKKEKICIKAKYKASTNFITIKSNFKPQKKVINGKKKFIK